MADGPARDPTLAYILPICARMGFALFTFLITSTRHRVLLPCVKIAPGADLRSFEIIVLTHASCCTHWCMYVPPPYMYPIWPDVVIHHVPSKSEITRVVLCIYNSVVAVPLFRRAVHHRQIFLGPDGADPVVLLHHALLHITLVGEHLLLVLRRRHAEYPDGKQRGVGGVVDANRGRGNTPLSESINTRSPFNGLVSLNSPAFARYSADCPARPAGSLSPAPRSRAAASRTKPCQGGVPRRPPPR